MPSRGHVVGAACLRALTRLACGTEGEVLPTAVFGALGAVLPYAVPSAPQQLRCEAYECVLQLHSMVSTVGVVYFADARHVVSATLPTALFGLPVTPRTGSRAAGAAGEPAGWATPKTLTLTTCC